MKRSKEISIVIVTEADISSVMTEQAGWENSIGNSCCQIRNIRITILIEFSQSVPRFFQRLRVLILIFIPNVYDDGVYSDIYEVVGNISEKMP